jgi:hypothetical protein
MGKCSQFIVEIVEIKVGVPPLLTARHSLLDIIQVGIPSLAMGAKGLPGAIRKLLPSLVRILLRNGMAAKSFYDMAKKPMCTFCPHCL